ncbi:MAG TPA: DUF1054 family protein [Patescibacteria group bacterium]|nr:DUF1054 family protein [Patescibacteria group bacterium]
MARLGFLHRDFEVFKISDFNARMEKIYEFIRPRLIRLSNELAPELSRTLQIEFLPHVATHMRLRMNPPSEAWAAFGPFQIGYKRYPYLALCISAAGIHARATVKPDADKRPEIGQAIRSKSCELEKSFRGTKIQDYSNWNYRELPASRAADARFFERLGDTLSKKDGTIDVGFGWPVHEALTVDRAELLDAFVELSPLYRAINSVKE